MMIGTADRARSARHTSMPESLGSITSSSTMSGRTASNTSSASLPSRATWTRNPSRLSPTVRASTKLSSSSTTSTVADGSVTTAAPLLRAGCRTGHVTGRGGRDRERERRSAALVGDDGDAAAVVVGDVADDGEAEAGAARVSGTGAVDAVEPLEDAVEVARRDADAVVAHVELPPAVVFAHLALHRRAGVGVLHRVLDQVVQRRRQL